MENIVPDFFHIVNRFCDKNWYVAPEPRNFHNFMLIASGEGISFTDGAEYPILPGVLVYHHPGQSFGFDTSKSNLMHCFGINFHLASAACNNGSWTARTVDKLPLKHITPILDMDLMTKLFTDLSDTWTEARRNYRLQCRIIFMKILLALSREAFLQKGNTAVLQKLEIVTAYIHKHYALDIPLSQLSSLVDLNPSYLGSLFKKHLGQTPVQYVNEIRIRKSEEYLDIGYTITEASSLCGFSDPFYYSKVFKKVKGVCPKSYIQKGLKF